MNTIMSRPFLIVILILIAVAVAAVLAYLGDFENDTVQEQVAVPETPAQPQETDAMGRATTPEGPTIGNGLQKDGSKRASSDTTVQGIISVVGNYPFAQPVLDYEGGPQIGVTGPLRAEIRQLSGVEVRVWGTLVPNDLPPPLQAIEVSEYEVISVDGQKPHVGILTETDGILRLDGLIVVGAPDLQRDVGAKVLILGRVSGDTLEVDGYRFIRQP